MNQLSIPEYVVVGHICQDLLPDGSLGLGGSVSYAAKTALQMGCQVGVVTSTAPGLELDHALPGAQIVRHPSAVTTVFENIYRNGKRRQIIHQRADVIRCEHIPLTWRAAPMVYLGSIDQEIAPDVLCCFSAQSLICVMPQGFFRRWDEQGNISYTEWQPEEWVLQRTNVLVISELDVPDPDGLVIKWGPRVDTIVVTRAERGASVYHAGDVCHYPARPAQEVDPTGAGDVFAAAFLLRFYETRDPCLAARFANVAASFSVEGRGTAGIPTRQRVEDFVNRVGEPPPFTR